MFYRSIEAAMIEAAQEALDPAIKTKEDVLKTVRRDWGHASRKAKKTR